VRHRLCDRINWAGQHEAERMEEPHARRVQTVRCGQPDNFAEIPEQHHCASHRNQIAFPGDRDRLLHLRLLYPDAHVAQHQLDQILGLNWSRAAEKIAQQHPPGCSSLCRGQLGKKICHIFEGQRRAPRSGVR
jgi:hypothetical protein